MNVETLKREIDERVQQLIVPILLRRLGEHHKKGWRVCPCSYCTTKREATAVIANPAPIHQNLYVGSGMLSQRGERDILRDVLRSRYRNRLKEEFER